MNVRLDAVPRGLAVCAVRVLGTLHEQGPTLMSNLADAVGVSRADMTGRIDQLESRGLVVRGSIAGDRRAVLVSLTPEGEKLAGEIFR